MASAKEEIKQSRVVDATNISGKMKMDKYEHIVKGMIQVFSFLIPIIISISQFMWKFYKSLPENALQLLIGFIYCFFGGLYPTCFAAIEAAKHGGIREVAKAFSDLSTEALKVIDANKKDDDLDENKDGIKDVKQISEKELILRKTNLVVTKANPDKVNNAISCIYKVWISVAAVLSLKFARNIALSQSISSFFYKPCHRFLLPVAKKMTPDSYEKWLPTILRWIVNLIAITIAWKVQLFISAFTSALVGSLIITRTALKITKDNNIKLGGLLPENHTDTLLDEVLSYVIAAVGFYFQLKHNFSAPFPLNLVLLPLEMTEQCIRWCISG